MPHWAAAAVTDNCAETTLRTATWCFDMQRTVTHVPTHLSPIMCHLCPELRHLPLRHHRARLHIPRRRRECMLATPTRAAMIPQPC